MSLTVDPVILASSVSKKKVLHLIYICTDIMCLNHASFTFNGCHGLTLVKCQVPMKVVHLPSLATVGQWRGEKK